MGFLEKGFLSLDVFLLACVVGVERGRVDFRKARSGFILIGGLLRSPPERPLYFWRSRSRLVAGLEVEEGARETRLDPRKQRRIKLRYAIYGKTGPGQATQRM